MDSFAQLYERWVQLRDWSLGPSLRCADSNSDEISGLTHLLIEKCSWNICELSIPEVIDVASPWEAAFVMAAYQNNAINDSCNYIFRGQKRSEWGLTSSIDRLVSDQDAHSRALIECIIFCTMMHNLHTDYVSLSGVQEWNFELILPFSSYMPVAQHYGIPTPLLDFTVDPAVAVYFASRDDQYIHGQTASVKAYKFPFDNSNNELLNLKFVPPFIERPYLQKGIFIESNVQGDISTLVQPDFEIRFPVTADNYKFRVVRESEIELLPMPEEITVLKAYAKAGVSDFIMENQGKSLSPELIHAFAKEYCKKEEHILRSLYKKQIKDPVSLTRRYVDEFEDMMYWLCYFPDNDGLRVNFQGIETVVKSNPEIILMVVAHYRRIISISGQEEEEFSNQKVFIIKIIEIFSGYLKKYGYSSDDQVNLDKWF
jgi:hypothetical protein